MIKYTYITLITQVSTLCGDHYTKVLLHSLLLRAQCHSNTKMLLLIMRFCCCCYCILFFFLLCAFLYVHAIVCVWRSEDNLGELVLLPLCGSWGIKLKLPGMWQVT